LIDETANIDCRDCCCTHVWGKLTDRGCRDLFEWNGNRDAHGFSHVAGPLNFGTNGVLATAINQQTNVAVTCTNTTPYNVGLDAGTVTGSSVTSRLMAGTATGNTATTVGFQLYQDSGHTTVWGNTQGTNTVAGTGTGAAQSIAVYGQVPAQSTPKPDTYQTTVTATVYF
jgi:spore coat protein U-like protein